MANEKTKRFEEEARPNSGTSTVDRKIDPEGQTGEQAFAYRFNTDNKVRTAEESDEQSAKQSKDAQCGRNTPSGGRVGDCANQPTAGGDVDYEQFARKASSPKNPKDFDSK
jgi:hypothetical protein